MGDIFNGLFGFFFIDEKHKVSKKLLAGILAIATLLFLDYYFEISYSVYLNNKLDTIAEVNTILADPGSLTENQIEDLKNLRAEAVEQKYFWTKIQGWFSWESDWITYKSPKEKVFKQSFGYKFASTYMAIITYVTFFLLVLSSMISNRGRKLQRKRLIALILFTAFGFFFGSLTYYIGQVMPYFSDSHWINYSLIVLVQTFIGFTFQFILGQKKVEENIDSVL